MVVLCPNKVSYIELWALAGEADKYSGERSAKDYSNTYSMVGMGKFHHHSWVVPR